MGFLKIILFFSFIAPSAFAGVGDTIQVTQFLKYKLVRSLAESNYGEVFQIEMNGVWSPRFVVKILYPGNERRSEIILENNRAVMNFPAGPYVAQVYAVYDNISYEGNNVTVITMERLDENLLDLMSRLTFEERVEIAPKILNDILQGLLFFKENKRVHGDVKITNIMTRGYDQFVLIDYDFSIHQDNGSVSPTMLGFEDLAENRVTFERDVWRLGETLLGFLFNRGVINIEMNSRAVSQVQAEFRIERQKLDPEYVEKLDFLERQILSLLNVEPTVRARFALYGVMPDLSSLTCPRLF